MAIVIQAFQIDIVVFLHIGLKGIKKLLGGLSVSRKTDDLMLDEGAEKIFKHICHDSRSVLVSLVENKEIGIVIVDIGI